MVKKTDITFKKISERFLEREAITEDQARKLVGDTYENVFYASNVQRISLVRSLQKSLANAIEEGLSFQDWKESDPVKTIRNISDARKETIFRTNFNTAYHDGIIEETKAVGGYLRYSAVLDDRVRPSHAALHDITLPASDSFWKRYRAPLGFNCRCTTIPVSKSRAERDDLKTDRSNVNRAIRRYKQDAPVSDFPSGSFMNDTHKDLQEKRIKELSPRLQSGVRSGTNRLKNKIKKLKKSLF